jgi:large subunit ribosomal protein L21e
VKKSKGYRVRTRSLFKKNPRERGRMKLSKLLYEYPPGSRVVIMIDSSVQKGMPHRRYHGRVGTIVDRRGRGYIVNVTQGNAVREIIIRSEHLEPYKGD